MLPRLTIFRSPFERKAVDFIFGPRCGSFLDDFHDGSFLRRMSRDEGDAGDRCRLYYFHPIIRQYLREIVQKEKVNLEKEYGSKFTTYQLNLIREVTESIATNEYASTLECFSTIVENEENDIERVLPSIQNKVVYSDSSGELGFIFYHLSHYGSALRYLRSARTIHDDLGNTDKLDHVNRILGEVHFAMGDFAQALMYHEERLASANRREDVVVLGDTYSQIAKTLSELRRLQQALDYATKAEAIYLRLKDETNLARVYSTKNVILVFLGRFYEGLEYRQKAANIHRKHNDLYSLGDDFIGIGMALVELGRIDEAIEYHKKTLEIFLRTPNSESLARSYTYLGYAMRASKKFEEALEHHKKALQIHMKNKNYFRCAITI